MTKSETINIINDLLLELRSFEKLYTASNYNKATVIYKKSKDCGYVDGMASALIQIGIYNYYNGNLEEALDNYMNCLSLSKIARNYKLQINALINISLVYDKRKLYTQTLYYLLEAAALQENIIFDNDYTYSKLLNNIGNTYGNLGFFDQAEESLRKSLEYISENDTLARYNYVQTCGDLLMIYSQINRVEDAKKLLDSAIQFSNDLDENFVVYNITIYKGYYNYAIGNISKAHSLFYESLNYGIENLNDIQDMVLIEFWSKMLIKYDKYEDLLKLNKRITSTTYSSNIETQLLIINNQYLIEKNNNDIEKAFKYLEDLNVLREEFELINNKLVVSKLNGLRKIQETNEKVRESYDRDPMSGCFNRRMLDKLDNNLCELRDKEISFIMIDIDNFKSYNDNYGHMKGDEVIIQVTKRIFEFLDDKEAFFIRYGGDEFAIIFIDQSIEKVSSVARTILYGIQNMNIMHEYSDVADNITLSIGVKSFYGDDINKIKTCLDSADVQLYKAKEHGRNCIFVNDELIK